MPAKVNNYTISREDGLAAEAELLGNPIINELWGDKFIKFANSIWKALGFPGDQAEPILKLLGDKMWLPAAFKSQDSDEVMVIRWGNETVEVYIPDHNVASFGDVELSIRTADTGYKEPHLRLTLITPEEISYTHFRLVIEDPAKNAETVEVLAETSLKEAVKLLKPFDPSNSATYVKKADLKDGEYKVVGVTEGKFGWLAIFEDDGALYSTGLQARYSAALSRGGIKITPKKPAKLRVINGNPMLSLK